MGVCRVADGLLVGVGAAVAVWVGVSVGCCEGVGREVLVRVAEAVRVGTAVVDGAGVKVVLINGTSVGGTKRVAVALGVGEGTVGLAGDRQRQIKMAELRQYKNSEVSSTTARIDTSSFWGCVSCAYWSVAFRTSGSPE